MSWHGIEGHDQIVESFRQVLRRGRLAHAYLFVGPSGIGKRRFARTLAQALLCEMRDEADLEPCGACPACAQVEAGSHPDLILTAKERDQHELSIDSVRTAIRALGFKADRGRGKIAIIDDADDMNAYAANCFLKSLEEPPPRSLLILIGTSIDRQLPTIRSRCQTVAFQPLPEALVAELLTGSGAVTDPAEAARLARASGGSPERARGLADPVLAEFRGVLWEAIGSGRRDSVSVSERMNALIEQAGSEAAEKRKRARLLVGMAAEFLHAGLRRRAGVQQAGIDPNEQPALDAFVQRRSAEEIARLIERTLEADYQIDRRAAVALVIEAWADEVIGG